LKKDGKTIVQIDQERSGLVNFGIHKVDQENSLEILRRGRKGIAKLAELARPQVSNLTSTDTHGHDFKQHRKELDIAQDIDFIRHHVAVIRDHLASAWRSCPILRSNQVYLALLPMVNTKTNAAFFMAHHGTPSLVRLPLPLDEVNYLNPR
jgi:hypothetical protein